MHLLKKKKQKINRVFVLDANFVVIYVYEFKNSAEKSAEVWQRESNLQTFMTKKQKLEKTRKYFPLQRN